MEHALATSKASTQSTTYALSPSLRSRSHLILSAHDYSATMQPEHPPANVHMRYMSPPPPAKRRRTMSSDCDMMDVTPNRILFQDLPLEAVKQILRHLHCPTTQVRPEPPPSSAVSFLRQYAPLRELCVLLRDAFDAHVTVLDLSKASAKTLPRFISLAMPRYINLSSLTVPEPAVRSELSSVWRAFFDQFRGRVSRLTFVAGDSGNEVAEVLARGCAAGLERVSTTSLMLLVWVGRVCHNVHSLELLMDKIEPEVLATVKGLRFLKLLFRERLVENKAWRLVQTLKQCERLLHSVELRLNHATSAGLGFVPEVPRLRKLSLFDGDISGPQRGMEVIARCAFLEELQLEWLKGLNGDDIEALARLMGSRLRKLRIWNCEDVTDRGLQSLATLCPQVEVELTFERDQFDPRTLALFGDRVSWGSYAI